MGIQLKSNIDLGKFEQQLDQKVERELGRILEEEAERIVTDTKSGRDINGRGFRKYTQAYLKRRLKKGRGASPDLTFTGKMLAAITSKIERVGGKLRGRIYFSSASEFGKAEGNLQKRRFFGLSSKARNRIIEKLKKAIGS